MKVLLDENLPHDLRHQLVGHDVFTVAFQRWTGVKNGALLRLAADAGFEVMVTLDNGVAYQQNRTTLPLAVIVLSAVSNDLEDLLPLLPPLLKCLTTIQPCTLARVP